MMMYDLHTHSYYSDGAASPRRMVESAIEKGLDLYGLSDHGYAPYDLECCIPLEKCQEYVQEVRRLQEEYAGRIDLKLGLEQDALSGSEETGYDYKIGSVHYVKDSEGRFWTVDDKPRILREGAEQGFGGDIYALLEQYWQIVSEVVERTDCDIIGHFDLCSKFCELPAEKGGGLFDPGHPRYTAAWQRAADILLKTGKPFEINVGAISRGFRTVPYPHPHIAGYLIDRGAAFVLSSDSHSAANIAYQFGRWEAFYRALGANIIEPLF